MSKTEQLVFKRRNYKQYCNSFFIFLGRQSLDAHTSIPTGIKIPLDMWLMTSLLLDLWHRLEYYFNSFWCFLQIQIMLEPCCKASTDIRLSYFAVINWASQWKLFLMIDLFLNFIKNFINQFTDITMTIRENHSWSSNGRFMQSCWANIYLSPIKQCVKGTDSNWCVRELIGFFEMCPYVYSEIECGGEFKEDLLQTINMEYFLQSNESTSPSPMTV